MHNNRSIVLKEVPKSFTSRGVSYPPPPPRKVSFWPEKKITWVLRHALSEKIVKKNFRSFFHVLTATVVFGHKQFFLKIFWKKWISQQEKRVRTQVFGDKLKILCRIRNFFFFLHLTPLTATFWPKKVKKWHFFRIFFSKHPRKSTTKNVQPPNFLN